jgi:hypothetical protein
MGVLRSIEREGLAHAIDDRPRACVKMALDGYEPDATNAAGDSIRWQPAPVAQQRGKLGLRLRLDWPDLGASGPRA